MASQLSPEEMYERLNAAMKKGEAFYMQVHKNLRVTYDHSTPEQRKELDQAEIALMYGMNDLTKARVSMQDAAKRLMKPLEKDVKTQLNAAANADKRSIKAQAKPQEKQPPIRKNPTSQLQAAAKADPRIVKVVTEPSKPPKKIEVKREPSTAVAEKRHGDAKAAFNKKETVKPAKVPSEQVANEKPEPKPKPSPELGSAADSQAHQIAKSRDNVNSRRGNDWYGKMVNAAWEQSSQSSGQSQSQSTGQGQGQGR